MCISNTVDDLESVIQDNLHSRQIAARQADEIVASQVHCYMDWVGSLDAVAVIRAIRARADARRERVLVAARRRLALDPGDVLEQLARRLTSTLIHPPSAKLRRPTKPIGKRSSGPRAICSAWTSGRCRG